MQELTPKQEAFVNEYLIDLNATQAAIRAGYSERTAMVQASRLLRNVKVAAAVEQARGKRMERTEINADWVVKGLVENVNRAMQATQVSDRKGEPTGEWQYEGAVANRALELVGRHLGMFIDRSEIDVTHHNDSLRDEFTIEEMRALLAEVQARRALAEPPVLEGEGVID